MKPPKALREHLKLLKKMGVSVVDTETTGSNHYRIIASFDGRTRFFIVANTPSDYRSKANFRGDVMRWKQGKEGIRTSLSATRGSSPG